MLQLYLLLHKVIQLQLVQVVQVLQDLVILTKQVALDQIQFFQVSHLPVAEVVAVLSPQVMVEHPQQQVVQVVVAEPIVNREQQETLLL